MSVHTKVSTKKVASVLSQAKYSNGAILMACVGVVAAMSSQQQSSQAERKRKDGHHYLEMYLMEKIAKKPYLNHNSVEPTEYQHQAKRYYRGAQNEEHSNKKNTDAIPDNTRPKGVPSRLRLLAIDVPQFKQDAFERGICRMPSDIFDTDKPSYVDGVAPSKTMNKTLGHNHRAGTRASRKPIVQKSLAKQLYYCYDPQHGKNLPEGKESKQQNMSEDPKLSPPVTEEEESQDETKEQPSIGVEILEASIMDLNPNNIRRTYTTSSMNWKKKSYKYDPGKYTERNASAENSDDDEGGVADVDEAEVEEESLEQKSTATESQLEPDDDDADDDLTENEIDNADYERYAPWNQYAWLEELHLRMNGMVPFGAPVQRATLLSQWFHGQIYQQSVPASSSRGGWISWLWWPVLWSGSHAIGSQRYRTSWDGADGAGESDLYGSDAGRRGNAIYAFLPWRSSKAMLNRASNKPHAVICDGAAMQRVPGSLRYLTKICREAGIPLYILNDPRSWGSQTHSTLSDAVFDMRKVIADNVIRTALDLREGSAFERGRLVGQLEKEMAWQAHDAARKTREALMDARQRLRMDKVEDWCELSEEELLKKLIERKVITLPEEDGEDEWHLRQTTEYSEGLLGLCRQCLETQEQNQSPTDQANQ